MAPYQIAARGGLKPLCPSSVGAGTLTTGLGADEKGMDLMNRWPGWKDLGNVVSMRTKAEPDNARSLLWQLEAYWAALPRVGLVPRRSDVDPRGVEALLAHAVILERVAPSVARFRIAGQHLSALTGMEVRGMPLTALFAAKSREMIAAAVQDMFDRPAILRAELSGQPKALGRAVSGQMILLPLCTDSGEVTRAIGAIITSAKPTEAPQKLIVSDMSVQPISDGPLSAPQPSAFAEEQTPFDHPSSHLRLVHSND